MLRTRRRPRYGWHVCAVISALLLLLSVSLLYTRLSQNDTVPSSSTHHQYDYELDSIQQNPLLSDDNDTPDSQDKIDEFDDDDDRSKSTDIEDDQELDHSINKIKEKTSNSLYYMDHVAGSIRRALNKRSIEEWDYDYSGTASFFGGLSKREKDEAKGAFGSDDVPMDEEVRLKIGLVESVEDALLLKVSGVRVSPLWDGWGDWFERKWDFLRRDRMFKSNLESLNPLNNPMLQDPDGVGVTGLTQGDKAVQKWVLSEIRKAPPFLVKKPSSVGEENWGKAGNSGSGKAEENSGNRALKREDRQVKEVNLGQGLFSRKLDNVVRKVKEKNLDGLVVGKGEEGKLDDRKGKKVELGNRRKVGNVVRKGAERVKVVPEELRHVYADGRRWGYFPGLDSRLSFSEFVDSYFRRGKCSMRLFMVWNSPPWMYGVRHQRGLESLLSMHRDACVVVLSETIELDFFKDSFVKDGFKVAVVMPNLDELLKDTPAHVFSSVWFQWRRTKFYPIHYSELVRLAALYKYGGIYLDSDIIVLNSLASLNNTVGLEDQLDETSLNGAVMAFRKGSRFMRECLKEFYMTYDDTHLTWNGADLLTRVARNSSIKQQGSIEEMELKVQPSYVFFPISSKDITRYFTKPATEGERLQQDAIFEKVIGESLTFHFWNSLTSSLIPEPESLVARLIDHSCIHCYDIL